MLKILFSLLIKKIISQEVPQLLYTCPTDLDLPGNDLTFFDEINGWEECSQKCLEIQECDAWTYLPTWTQCWLKSPLPELAYQKDDLEVKSGYRNCTFTIPTLSPTQNPTQNPTLSPTQRPTPNPTQIPTPNPTLSSTEKEETDVSWVGYIGGVIGVVVSAAIAFKCCNKDNSNKTIVCCGNAVNSQENQPEIVE